MGASRIWGRNMAGSQTGNLKKAEAAAAAGKQELRRRISQLRSALTPEEKAELDRRLRERVEELLAEELLAAGGWLARTGIYAYVSHGGEPDTRGLLERFWELGIPVAVPRVEGADMTFCQVSSFADLEAGYRGILEPRKACPAAAWPKAPVLVPGAAFTRNGGRLGWGGGYYDRFLAREPQRLRIALAYGSQVMERLPLEAHDLPVDVLVTEEETLDKINRRRVWLWN